MLYRHLDWTLLPSRAGGAARLCLFVTKSTLKETAAFPVSFLPLSFVLSKCLQAHFMLGSCSLVSQPPCLRAELWNPMWSVSTVCTGLLSFMLEGTATTGSIETSVRRLPKIHEGRVLQHCDCKQAGDGTARQMQNVLSHITSIEPARLNFPFYRWSEML